MLLRVYGGKIVKNNLKYFNIKYFKLLMVVLLRSLLKSVDNQRIYSNMWFK